MSDAQNNNDLVLCWSDVPNRDRRKQKVYLQIQQSNDIFMTLVKTFILRFRLQSKMEPTGSSLAVEKVYLLGFERNLQKKHTYYLNSAYTYLCRKMF